MCKSIFNFEPNAAIAKIMGVDTGTALAYVEKEDNMSSLQINQLVAIESPNSGKHIIGMIIKMARRFNDSIFNEEEEDDDEQDDENISNLNPSNVIKIVFVGELHCKIGEERNVFKRNVTTLPCIMASCYKIEGENLTNLMECISSIAGKDEHALTIGRYFIDKKSIAYLDGDKLFQRHAAIVGSTGSGKSYCVAKLVEQMSELKMADAILFDIHGEYSEEDFQKEGIIQLRIASPSDLSKENKLDNNILMIPYWLLNYEEMQALILDRSDTNAPNQAMQLSKLVLEQKDIMLKGTPYEDKITLDSPVPYKIESVLDELKKLDTKLEPGERTKQVKGAFNGKLTRFNQRLENKINDKRFGFMFSISDEELDLGWLLKFCNKLMGTNDENNTGIKVIDFSEVPSDILPLVVGLIARLVFSVQQWSNKDCRHPIALLCDEAHLYVQQLDSHDSVSEIGLKSFERIAKEGRKYGTSLVIISQRPSEVNKTVLSQCNNFISLRLTNVEDQNTIKRLLPDNLGNIANNLALLDIGESIIVGDCTLLPSRIKIEEPTIKPSSATIKFWHEWNKETCSQNLESAINNMIKQYKE